MASGTTNKVKAMNLKILIDRRANKVVFAEADKEFVDFIFHILSLPLSTVVKLLNDEGMVGCLGDLYKSIDSLNNQYFEPNLNKDSVLKPKSPLSVPLLSLDNSKSNSHKQYNGTTPQGYVKEAVAYLVMDNLEVKPMSISLVKAYASDFGSLEEKHVQVGLQEGLAMLKASLQTKNVLTAAFLGQKDNVLLRIRGIRWFAVLAIVVGVLHLVAGITTSYRCTASLHSLE